MRVKPVLGIRNAGRDVARRFHVARAVLFIGVLLFAPFCRAETAVPVYELKAAFLYNFAKFIQWPPTAFASADTPLVVGVIGHNPFGNYLNELQKYRVGSHPIEIEQFDDAEQARKGNCHVLFIGDHKQTAKIVAELQSAHADVLTVTDEVDTDSFQSDGAVINLVTTANRTVHFEINVDAARRAELKINSSLLNLAKIVRDGKA